jgi:regulation of enolase protein 1 (concanavalin A-like superfamily)
VRGETKIVSVVTRRWSDDADHVVLAEPGAWLRITRKGAVLALHWSEDGRLWRFVRVFPLELPDEVAVGALAQAPRAPGGSVLFQSLASTTVTVADFRSGE